MGLHEEGSGRIITVITMSLDDMTYLVSGPYKHNRRLYLLVGLWPYEDSSIRCWRTRIVSLIFFISITVQTYLLLTSELKVQPITELMTTYLPTIGFSACYYNILFQSDKVKIIRERIDSDFSKLANEQERDAMRKYVDQNKLYSIIIACVFYLYIGFLHLPSFYSLYLHDFDENNGTELVLPIRIEYCLHHRIRYVSMLSFQFVAIFIICTVGLAYYTMVISCLQHACALFTVVAVKINQSLKEKVDDSTSSAITHRTEHVRILSVIKSYNGAINFVDLLTSVSTTTYCIEVLLALLFLIIDFLHLFRLLDMMITGNEAIIIVIYIIGNITMIYSAFYMGQRLIDHSINVYAQCCQVPFYALSIKTQKLLVMLIMRSLKPCSINVNGMMVTSHEVFAKIANVSYSFAIVCYRMR